MKFFQKIGFVFNNFISLSNIKAFISNIWILFIVIFFCTTMLFFFKSKVLNNKVLKLEDSCTNLNYSLKSLTEQNLMLYNQIQEFSSELGDMKSKYSTLLTQNQKIKQDNAAFLQSLQSDIWIIQKKMKDVNFRVYKMRQHNLPDKTSK
mgnify:CR=1 FL=1